MSLLLNKAQQIRLIKRVLFNVKYSQVKWLGAAVQVESATLFAVLPTSSNFSYGE
ncbi:MULTISPECIES: hypothetical protein [Vibrio]|uniref:Uncharacterized protein n=1 Tax=Vibrio nitrifigilis TaxID=2789781 RepID=A0ABS0GJR5_9VIBR|nr:MULTISPECIES: hypothetical protein [Vibrio]MBF9002702.1 hypothetical protein [Vibrio nitrifigilis]